jgi:hypothetical protein
MIEPIQVGIEYGLSWNILWPDVLSLVFPGLPYYKGDGDPVAVPTPTEISADINVDFSDDPSAAYPLTDRSQVETKNSLHDQLVTELIRAVSDAGSYQNRLTVAGGLDHTNVEVAFRLLVEGGFTPHKIITSPHLFGTIRTWPGYHPVEWRTTLEKGIFGQLWGADVYATTLTPKTSVYVLAPPQYIGVMPIRNSLSIVPTEKSVGLSLRGKALMKIGMAVLNPEAIARITVLEDLKMVEKVEEIPHPSPITRAEPPDEIEPKERF